MKLGEIEMERHKDEKRKEEEEFIPIWWRHYYHVSVEQRAKIWRAVSG